MSHHRQCCCNAYVYVVCPKCECNPDTGADSYLILEAMLIEDVGASGSGVYMFTNGLYCAECDAAAGDRVTLSDPPEVIGEPVAGPIESCEECCAVVYCPGTLCSCDSPQTSGSPIPLVPRERLLADLGEEGCGVYIVNRDCWTFCTNVVQDTVGPGEMVIEPNELYEDCSACCPATTDPACCESDPEDTCWNRRDADGGVVIEWWFLATGVYRECCFPIGEECSFTEVPFSLGGSGSHTWAVGSSVTCADINSYTTPNTEDEDTTCGGGTFTLTAGLTITAWIVSGEPIVRIQGAVTVPGSSFLFEVENPHCFAADMDETQTADSGETTCSCGPNPGEPWTVAECRMQAGVRLRGRHPCQDPDAGSGGGGGGMLMAAPPAEAPRSRTGPRTITSGRAVKGGRDGKAGRNV